MPLQLHHRSSLKTFNFNSHNSNSLHYHFQSPAQTNRSIVHTEGSSTHTATTPARLNHQKSLTKMPVKPKTFSCWNNFHFHDEVITSSSSDQHRPTTKACWNSHQTNRISSSVKPLGHQSAQATRFDHLDLSSHQVEVTIPTTQTPTTA